MDIENDPLLPDIVDVAHLVLLRCISEESSTRLTIEVLSIDEKQSGFCSNNRALTKLDLRFEERLNSSDEANVRPWMDGKR